MVECDFDRTKLTKVEFSGTRLVKSRFSGELREVIFQARAFSFPNEPPNTMDGVDFSKASLRWCDFRQLDLDRVVPPPEGEHVIVRTFPKFLDIAIARYRSTVPCRKAVAILEHMKKWLGPRQQIGFFHTDDLAEFLPPGEVDDFRILAASISL
jgi:hypothetical protein